MKGEENGFECSLTQPKDTVTIFIMKNRTLHRVRPCKSLYTINR